MSAPAFDPMPRAVLLLVGLILLNAGIEAVLLAADLNLLPAIRLRQTAYEFGGFWPGLLGAWVPNYPAQPYTMFVTYAFLHSGPVHLAVNMLTLWSLGQAVISRVGSWKFLLLYATAMLGGGLGFGLLAETLRPMVGASGGLFGLAGGLLAWNYVDRYSAREGLWPVVYGMAGLLVLNLLLWWLMDGLLAWQAHLGGFIAGWITALLIDPRGYPPEAPDLDPT